MQAKLPFSDEERNFTERRVLVPSVLFSPRFLKMVGAPEHTVRLTFDIEAGGVLHCKAIKYEDDYEVQSLKEWEVALQRTSPLYKIINGEL